MGIWGLNVLASSWLRGFVASWLRGFVASWLRGFVASCEMDLNMIVSRARSLRSLKPQRSQSDP
jgi:hypothetical protein